MYILVKFEDPMLEGDPVYDDEAYADVMDYNVDTHWVRITHVLHGQRRTVHRRATDVKTVEVYDE